MDGRNAGPRDTSRTNAGPGPSQENYKESELPPQERAAADGSRDNIPTRACQSCRLSKVRCIQPSPDKPCARCQRAGKLCIPTEQGGNRQKQSNSRMAELESRIDALATSIMQSQNHVDPAGLGRKGRSNSQLPGNPRISSASASSPQPDNVSRDFTTTSQKSLSSVLSGPSNRGAGQEARISSSSTPQSADPLSPPTGFESQECESIPHAYIDAVIAQNLDETTANNIFNRYTTGMAPNLPFVTFPAETKASDVRKANPVVFLSILDTASAGFCEVASQRNIRKLLVQVYLHYMLRTDEYSLPLLQALIISAAWYQPIEPIQPGEQMDVYQLSHTASNMAIIMGLDKKLGARSWGGPAFVQKQRVNGPHSTVQEKSLAARRVWLGCHYICSNTSMALHAPNVMRWTRYMDECLEALENSPAAFPTDKVFCQHSRLQHLIEEYELQLSWDNAVAASPTREIQAQVTHRAFKRQLLDWTNAVPKDCWNETLDFSRLFATLYINDVVLNSTCRQPHNSDSDSHSEGEQPQKLAINESTFSEFLETVNSIFRIILSLDMSAIRALPTVYFIRIVYVGIVLVKLHFAAMQFSGDEGELRAGELNVAERLDHLIQMFAGWGTLWPANRLMRVLRKLKTWFEKHSSCKMMLHELSWLNPWVFKQGSDTGFDSENPQPVSSVSPLPALPIDPIPPESGSHAPSQSTLDWTIPDEFLRTPAPHDLSTSSALSPESHKNAVHNIMPLSDQSAATLDFSEPPNSMDLDQIFPGAMEGFEINMNANLDALGADEFGSGKFGFDSPQLQSNMAMSKADWSALFGGDASFDDAGDAMNGLEYDKVLKR